MTGYKSKRAAAQDKITDEQGRPMTYWGGKAQPEQEPDWKGLVLAHNAECDERCDKERCGYAPYFEANGRRCPTCPVYEKIDVDTPPQRTWVGLTEKDFSAINQSCLTKLQAAISAESILKEKNNGT